MIGLQKKNRKERYKKKQEKFFWKEKKKKTTKGQVIGLVQREKMPDQWYSDEYVMVARGVQLIVSSFKGYILLTKT